ncbi:MAG: methyl-accepting chemotaxis protein [Clostridiaceae bacterium]
MLKIKKLKNINIKNKLLIMFVCLIAIPFVSLAIFSYSKTESILEETLKTSSLEFANQTKYSINNYVMGYEESLTQMANDPNVIKFFAEDKSEISEEEMYKSFECFTKGHENVLLIYLGTNDKGIYAFPYTEFKEDYDPTVRPWYTKAVEKNEIIWTDPYNDSNTNELVVSAAIPINYENEIVGVLSLDISLETLSDMINGITIGKQGYAFITDSNNMIMTYKNNELVGQSIPITSLKDSISEKDEGEVDYTNEENGVSEKKFASFSKMDKLGWTVIVTMYKSEYKEHTTGLMKSILLFGLIVLFIAIVISSLFSRGLSRSLNKLSKNIERIKNGDLTVRNEIISNDEIGMMGNGFNSMIQGVSNLIGDIQELSKDVLEVGQTLAATSEETNASAEEISRTVEEISKGATNQALDADKGNQLTINLANKFVELNSNTDNILKSTSEVIKANEDGIGIVKILKEKTNQNEYGISEIEKSINVLDDKVNEIDIILETISSIAKQTNLLSLNASIEAARAGEEGKGFAIVAEEIRKLAESSKKSTEEIKQIVYNLQQGSHDSVEKMKEVKVISSEQHKAVVEVNISFDKISKSIEMISIKIKEIADYILKMNDDKEDIVLAIQNISAVSEQTAASAEEVSASMNQQTNSIEEVTKSAEKLNNLSNKLNDATAKFRI